MSLAAKEYTPEELDALEAQAKQRPVYDQIAGGVGAAMAYYDGPQESKAEYTPEELDARDALYAQPEMTPEELDQRLVNAKYDANTLLPPEQLREADAVEKRLRDQGKQPGVMDTAFALGGGILQSVADWNMALDKSGNVKAAVKNALIKTGVISGDYERMPMLEAALQAPASAKAGVQGATLNAMETAIALNGLAKGKPRYRVKETGEFVYAPLGGVAPLTQLAGEGKTLVPVTDADLEEHRYQQYATENAIRKTYLDLTSEEVFGQKPNQSFTLPVEIVADPWNLIAFGAANKVTGASRMGKLFSSKTLGAAEAVAGGSANIIDKGADVFTRAVQKMSFGLLKRDTQRAIAKSAAYGGGAAAIGTMLTNAPAEARNTALTLMSLYPMYKMGSGVLRRVEGAAGAGKLIMREAADATNGLDDVARAAVASNPRVPQQIREVLTNPSKFTPIESTPARIAKSEAFSPRVREVAARLANPLVVQASRAAGATARGAALGTTLNIPFAEAYREMGDERTADSVYAGGLLFGAAGGAASRVTGTRARRRDAAASDIGRMLVDIQKTNAGEDIGAPGVNRAFETYYSMAEPGRMLTDVELAGGDIDSLLRNTKFEDLAGMAAMQGFYRDTVDFVPLNAFDYEANVKALGGTGTAGYFLHAPEGQRARLFLNTDARRTDVAPHEYGHALLQSAATSPEMKNSARAFINQRYGPERLDAMAREYAGQLIKNRNAKAYPDQKLDVSQAEIDSMIYELGESGLGRGDGDRLDWLRDEIFAEEHRAAGIDYAQIRRNIPDGFSVVGFAENVLGANARALGVAGVPIDPQTGALRTPPDRLFKDNPLLAADAVMRRNVQQYVRAYKQWLNDPAHEVPTGAPVSRTGNPNELKNNPNVTFRDYGNGRLENELAFIDENGNVKVKDKKNDPERAKFIRARQQQVREMIDRGTKEPSDPTFGARVRDGQRIVAGKKLPPRFDMTRFPGPLKELARRMEALAEAGETMQVRYFALGKSKDVFKQGDIRGVQAINREVMFVEWQATKDGNINAFVVDLTQFRNRAMKAIADRDPSLSEINWDFKQLEADLRRVLDNHANGRAGADGIGDKRRNAVNALLGIGTKINRGANPLTGLGGKGSALKTLRLDAFDEVAGTGRQGFEFDYQKANGNFMPDKPAPRPNMDSDIELPNRMPSALPQAAVRGERADIPLNPRARQAAFISHRGEVRSTGRATHFETNEDLGPDFLAIGAGHLGEDGFFRFGSQTMDDAMGDSPTTSAAAAARFNQSLYDQGRRPSAMLEEPPGLERPAMRGQAMPDVDEVLAANRTARAAGAVGARAITPRYVAATVRKGETVLNFGAGKPDPATGKYGHSESVRAAGGIVDEFDFGANAVGALGKQYDTVMASNVLNVQSGRDMLRSTLSDIAASSRSRAVMNYPESPRYLDLSADEVAAEIRSVFGAEPKIVGGTKRAPLWDVAKKQAPRGQAMPDVDGSKQSGYDNTYLKQALAAGANGKVKLTRPIKPNEALPLLSQVEPITERVDKDTFTYDRPALVELYKNGERAVAFKYDPDLLVRPNFKDVAAEHAGKQVQLAMADRQSAVGGDMGGVMNTYLKSLREVKITDPMTGRKLIAVWANNDWKPARAMKGKAAAGAKDLLTYLMGETAHGSNLRSVRRISNEIDNAPISAKEKNAFLIIANRGVKKARTREYNAAIAAAEIKASKLRERLSVADSKNKAEIRKQLNRVMRTLSDAKTKITKYKISTEEDEFAAVVRNYRSARTGYENGTATLDVFKTREEEFFKYLDGFKRVEYREKTKRGGEKKAYKYVPTDAFKKLQTAVRGKHMVTLDNTFDGRKAAVEDMLGLTVSGFNIDHILPETADFQGGRINHIVSSVELSTNPELGAAYLGDDPQQAKFMTPLEAAAAKKMKASSKFTIHEAYAWVMLGPEDGNHFLNSNPKTPEQYFPTFKQRYAETKTDPAKKATFLASSESNQVNTMRDQTLFPLVMPSK